MLLTISIYESMIHWANEGGDHCRKKEYQTRLRIFFAMSPPLYPESPKAFYCSSEYIFGLIHSSDIS